MKTKKLIDAQLTNYEKAYRETKNLDEFKTNIYNTIIDIESITPISPSYSSYLFNAKLDWENLDRLSVDNLLQSLKNFLEKLD